MLWQFQCSLYRRFHGEKCLGKLPLKVTRIEGPISIKFAAEDGVINNDKSVFSFR